MSSETVALLARAVVVAVGVAALALPLVARSWLGLDGEAWPPGVRGLVVVVACAGGKRMAGDDAEAEAEEDSADGDEAEVEVVCLPTGMESRGEGRPGRPGRVVLDVERRGREADAEAGTDAGAGGGEEEGIVWTESTR